MIQYTSKSAILSDCGQYRYLLQRTWDLALPRLCAIGLNPSTAEGELDDATVRVLVGRAQRMYMGGLDLVNLFALRATRPRDMMANLFPVSANYEPHRNFNTMAEVVSQAGFVLVCWGTHGSHRNKANHVLAALQSSRVIVHALRLNADGSPSHPLRISYDTRPFPI